MWPLNFFRLIFSVPVTALNVSNITSDTQIPSKHYNTYRGADKSLAPPTSRYILFDGENISFDDSLVIYINSTNVPPIMIINRIFEHQNLLSL